jgi:hypothetical protein
MPMPADRDARAARVAHAVLAPVASSMRRSLLVLAASALPVAAALAQPAANRVFPMTALRGDIQFGEMPEILVNGRPARLSPGARIRDTGNLVVTPAPLIGRRAVVNYTVDDLGNVRDVWLLTAEEASRRWPRTPAEAERMVFDPASQSWSRP